MLEDIDGWRLAGLFMIQKYVAGSWLAGTEIRLSLELA